MQSDQQLMQLVCKGSHAAFATLVRRHTDRFLALAIRTLHNHGDAEDIVQTAFVKLWQNPSSWKSEKSQFTTWFYRVVLNACHDFQRKHQRCVLAEASKLDAMLAPVESEQRGLEDRQANAYQQQLLMRALKELPSSQRDAINLVVYSAIPQKQAAQVMGISLKALESLLGRARRSLSKKLKEPEESTSLNGSSRVLQA